MQPTTEKDHSEEAQTTTNPEEGEESKGALDDMTEAVVERDGDIFEDAVEAVEKVTI